MKLHAFVFKFKVLGYKSKEIVFSHKHTYANKRSLKVFRTSQNIHIQKQKSKSNTIFYECRKKVNNSEVIFIDI